MRNSIIATSIFTCCTAILFLLFSTAGYSQSSSNPARKKVVEYDTIEVAMPDGTYEIRIADKESVKSIQFASPKANSENSGQKSKLQAPASKKLIDTIEIQQPDGTIEYRIIDRNSSYDCNDEKVYDRADIMPEFTGGQTALNKYMSDNLRYPSKEVQKGIAGQVLVQFTVNKHGQISNVSAIKFPPKGENLAKEAVNMVRMMPAWKPGKKNGLLVNVRCELPVIFKLKK